MIENRRITVNPSSSERLSFEGSIHRVWNWLKYTGLHPNLLLMSRKQHLATNIAQGLLTWLILLLCLGDGVFQLIQLVIVSWNVDNIVEAVPNFTFSSIFLFTLLAQYQMWSRRGEIKQLFKDWKKVELQSRCCYLPRTKRIVNHYIFCMVSMPFFSIIAVITYNLMEPEKSFFFSHYFIIRETFHPIFISASVGIIFSYLYLISLLTELIPTVFFYHIACTVTNLKEEWDAHFKDEQYIRVIWQRYERILHIVDRANELFGVVMAVRNLYYVFSLCLALYYTLVLFRDSTTIFVLSFAWLITFVGQLLWTNWLTSQLYFSCNRL